MPPLFGLLRLAPDFVEINQVMPWLQRVWVGVTEFEAAAFDGFELQILGLFVFVLLCLRYVKGVRGFQRCAMFLTVCNAS